MEKESIDNRTVASTSIDSSVTRKNTVAQEEPIYRPKVNASTVSRYFKTRVTELLPSRTKFQEKKHLLNPVPGIRSLSTKQWLFVASSFLSFTWELFDYFTITLNVARLLEDFDVTTRDITWGITLVLMVRTVGAVGFGIVGDKYGRKASFLANLAMMCALEIGTGFVKTYKQFLAVRALFGLVLGGVFGSAAAQCFDDCPLIAKDFIGGLFQQGYTFGYLLAVIFTRAIADNSSHTWRAVFWFAAGVTFLLFLFRLLLPETDAFIERQLEILKAKEEGEETNSIAKNLWLSFKNYWYMIIYMILMMVGFNFLSHGTQDLFPTMLTNQLRFGHDRSTVTNCLANIGAMLGGLTIPHIATICNKRLVIILSCCCAACLIYPWGFVHNSSVNASVFFMQFFIQGAWGLVPSHLNGLAPDPKTHAFYVGISYQLGNLASSASATIETTIGEQFPITGADGTTVYDYGRVMSILAGAVLLYLVLVVFLGPEKKPTLIVENEDNIKPEV